VAAVLFLAAEGRMLCGTSYMRKHITDRFTLGHSPDPDDAFMFYAIAENKIELRGYRFEHCIEDIQTLNERAQQGELHISAISIHAYPYVSKNYALLPCGASMGDGYGPIVVTKRSTSNIQHPASNASMTDDSARECVSGIAAFSGEIRFRRCSIRPNFRGGKERAC